MNFKFERFKNTYIVVRVRTGNIENFINKAWKSKIEIMNLVRFNANLIQFKIPLKDYKKTVKVARASGGKLKVVGRYGIGFLLFKLKNRISILFGIAAFLFCICYLSTFIWEIDITTEKNIAPYDVRQDLKSIGISPGIKKSNLNVYNIEEQLMQKNNNIMWARARIYGSKLKVKIIERQEIPDVKKSNETGDVLAKKSGQILRVYTTSGTAVVKPGDVVKKGQMLIKGEEGKEDNIYKVNANGKIIAKTFNENSAKVMLTKHERKRTGRQAKNYFVIIGGKKFYLKKSETKFDKYDKIVDDKYPIGIETYYEVNDKIVKCNKDDLVRKTSEKIYDKMKEDFDMDIKVVDKITDYSVSGNVCKVTLVVVCEEDIADN
ncbi:MULTISPECIES: sporulation protein YqfD [Clostridium]|uniref:sporulation protein YqfD n=1 Tax=Clostridium TaxID=1485 RepID=UPI000824942B|nr:MULTISPECIES: sporulation protein YqfD [Clostridium]PJI07078.1 sporulation protein YqfD [Clostridium sp. CT7]